jgi:hypothetical protein
MQRPATHTAPTQKVSTHPPQTHLTPQESYLPTSAHKAPAPASPAQELAAFYIALCVDGDRFSQPHFHSPDPTPTNTQTPPY